jgi:hypothetical protein
MKIFRTLALPAILATFATPSLPAKDFWVTAQQAQVPVGARTILTAASDVNDWPEAFFWRLIPEEAGTLTRIGPNQMEFLATSAVVPMPCRVEVIAFPVIFNNPIRSVTIQIVAPNAGPAGPDNHGMEGVAPDEGNAIA